MASTDKPIASLTPAIYAHQLYAIQVVAKLNGYAIAIHGSMQRDLDVVAIPWTDQASSAEDLVSELSEYMSLERISTDPVFRPHGRAVYTLLMGGSLFIDLSVMPRLSEPDPRISTVAIGAAA